MSKKKKRKNFKEEKKIKTLPKEKNKCPLFFNLNSLDIHN